MARKATTPAEATRKAREHIGASKAAIRTLTNPESDASEYMEAAKALEAAGCYIRRATERGLLP